MKSKNLSTDQLLAQATCAVLIGGKIVGTAWLVSDKGYLLTAGHVLGINESVDEVEVRFLKNKVYQAYKVKWRFKRESGIDFSFLKLRKPLNNNYIPLSISLTKSVEGTFRLRGYGSTLSGQSVGKGNILGANELSDDVGSRLFQLSSTEIGEEGYSGAAVFSDELNAVVALQVEATNRNIGAGRNTILAMPLYRVAEECSLLQDITNLQSISSSLIGYKLPIFDENEYEFANRGSDVKRISQLLEDNPYLHLYGPSGIGKTYLTVELLEKHYTANSKAYLNFNKDCFEPHSLSIKYLLREICYQLYNTNINEDLSLDLIINEIAITIKKTSKYGIIILDNINELAPKVIDQLRNQVFLRLQERIDDPTKYLRIIAVSQTKVEELVGFNQIYFEDYFLEEFGQSDLHTYKNLLIQAINKYRKNQFGSNKADNDNLLREWTYRLYDITGGHPKVITEILNYVGHKTKFGWRGIFDEQRQDICDDVLSNRLEKQVQASFGNKKSYQKAFRLLWIFRYLSRSVFKQLLEEVKNHSHWSSLNIVVKQIDYHPEYAPLWERFQETALLESEGLSRSRLPHRLTPIWRKQGNFILQVTDPNLYQRLHNDAAAVFNHFVFDKSSDDTSMRLSCFIEMLYHITQEKKIEKKYKHNPDFTDYIIILLENFILFLKHKPFFEENLYNLQKLLKNDRELRKEINEVGKKYTNELLIKAIKERM